MKTAQKDHEVSLINLLPVANGASWNPLKICLRDTRRKVIQEIIEFLSVAPLPPLSSTPPSERIYVLTGVAGAGKSAIAHSCAQECSEKSNLHVATFFFDKLIAQRNSPDVLFTTLASQISQFHPDVRAAISGAIEKDRSLLSAPPARQFEHLVLAPLNKYPFKSQSVAIVIDALDEGFDEDLVNILGQACAQLPYWVRVIVTTRAEDPIISVLNRPAHVVMHELNIRASESRDDLSAFARAKFNEISERRKLDSS